MRGDGAAPSSTGRALLQTVCVQGAPGVPTVTLKPRAQLPWVELTWRVNGTTVPQATVGATQTPKGGAIEATVEPLPASEKEAVGRVITMPGWVVESVPVTAVAVVSPTFCNPRETTASSPDSRM